MTASKPSQEALSLAKEASRQAVAHLRRLLEKRIDVDSDVARDVKLSADRESEQLILEILRRESDYPVLSEEGGWSGDPGERKDRWIVDPLDGSYNYLRGIPMCCVSIGLWRGEEPVLGVIHDIHTGEVFSGIVGIGAWLDDVRPLHVSAVTSTLKAVICAGFPVATNFSSAAIAEYVAQVRNYKKVRLLGSAALSLAYVAAGRADAYYERDIKVWDIAAGVALVEAAGGVVARTSVDSSTHGLTVDASNRFLPHAGV